MNLFTLHNVAASGGSICSQAISAYTDSLLISEINPIGPLIKRSQPFKQFEGFQPGRVLDKALLASKSDLSLELRSKYFEYQLIISIKHAISLNKNLALREHTHTTYPFKGESNKMGLLDLINSQMNIKELFKEVKIFQPILTVRHPLDNYISARKKNWHKLYCNGSFDNYCSSLTNMQKYFLNQMNAVILRYEDLCASKDGFFSNLSSKLGLYGYSVPSTEVIEMVAVTGKSGRKSSDICLRERQFELLDDNLQREAESSQAFRDLCALNNYNHEIKEHPI